MQQQKNGYNILLSAKHQQLLVKVVAVLGGPIVIGTTLLLLTEAHSADNWNIQVRAGLMESACRLEMASDYQDVRLGETGTAQLQQPGAQGAPVVIQLRLRDCLLTSTNNDDEHSDHKLWRSYQTAVSASFVAVADAENPQLVKVNGVSGVALRITDALGRDIRLGNHTAPLILTTGHDTLSYAVTPERTRAPLKTGAYSAQLNFRLNYE